MTLDEANALASSYDGDPDKWVRDLGQSLKNCINAAAPIVERQIKIAWLDKHDVHDEAEARELLTTFGLVPVQPQDPGPHAEVGDKSIRLSIRNVPTIEGLRTLV